MDAATMGMLRSSLTHVLTDGDDRPLSSRLDALGWDEVLTDDAAAALRALFEIRGATLSPADALGPVLGRALAESTGRSDLLGAAVVLPSGLHPDHLSARIDGDTVVAAGVTTAAITGVAVVAVPGGAGALRLAVVEPGAAVWTQQPLEGTDPSMGLVRVAATFPSAACAWIDGADASAAWASGAAEARWALAAELTAIGHHVVAGAVEYTGQRVQYGRPIGTFQALQHRLAGAHASLVGAADVVAEASSSGSPWAALVAKALAGRAAEHACTQAQQSYGAIGFTWEHDLHRSLRRTYVLDWLFGSWRTLEREIGARLIATGEVPRIGSL